MKNHVFYFRSENPGAIFVKEFSCSTTERCINLLTDMTKSNEIAAEITQAMNNLSHKNIEPKLCTVKSKKHGNREEYLRREILQRYFRGDDALAQQFFGDGNSTLAQ